MIICSKCRTPVLESIDHLEPCPNCGGIYFELIAMPASSTDQVLPSREGTCCE